MHVCYITVKSHFCLLCQMEENGSKHLCCPGYFQTPSECLHMYKGLVCSFSQDVFVRHLWVQEAALPWPCNQGMSAPRFRNAFFGSLFQCFSLWAALLRTEQYRSSTLRVCFSTLLPPQSYKDTKLPFLFNTYCILCKSFLAAVHREVHPLVQRSTLEVTAHGPKNLSTK